MYLEAKSNSISSYSLPPIFLTESNLHKEKSIKLYSDINKLFDGLHEYVISNKRLISWIPVTQIQNKKQNQGENVLELIIKLNDTYDNLYERLSRNHKRTIKRSIDMGQTIVQVDSNSSEYLISSLFLAYKEQHIMAAGRDRRPDESYEHMEKLIRLGISKLFVSMYKNEPISYLVAPENNKREVYKLLSPFAISDFGNHDSLFWIRLHPEFPKSLRYLALSFLIKRRKNVLIIKEPKDTDFCNSKFIISSGSSTVIKGLSHGCTPIYWETNPYDNANPFYLNRFLNNLSFKYPHIESVLAKAKCLSEYKLSNLLKNHAS